MLLNDCEIDFRYKLCMINKKEYNLLIEQDTLNLAAPGKVYSPRKRVLNRLRDIFAIY